MSANAGGPGETEGLRAVLMVEGQADRRMAPMGGLDYAFLRASRWEFVVFMVVDGSRGDGETGGY